MSFQVDYRHLLTYIPVAELTHDQWLHVGMALHTEGESWLAWDEWSRADSRYKEGECERRWKSFKAGKITGATIMMLAKSYGYIPQGSSSTWIHRDYASSYKQNSGANSQPQSANNTSASGNSESEFTAPKIKPMAIDFTSPFGSPAAQLTLYLKTLFDSGDLVSYCEPKDGHPTAGLINSVDDLLSKLEQGKPSISGIGLPDQSLNGLWCRMNPVSGERTERGGVADSSVVKYKWALIEIDELPLELQIGAYTLLNLPIAALVYSGKKSIHAICHIDAENHGQYKKRVQFLYDTCEKYGVKIDTACKNCGRLTRLPGSYRDGVEQSLLAVNMGASSFREWKRWIRYDQVLNTGDGYGHEVRSTKTRFANEKNEPLAPEIIAKILRKGHKMIISAPPKAGKSFLCLQLATCLAGGLKFLNKYQCRKSKVLYLNTEIDEPSFRERERAVDESMGIDPYTSEGFYETCLRGDSRSLDELIEYIIALIKRDHFEVVLIDPVYKIMSGDECSNQAMREFGALLDRICQETGASVIFVHHFSKGAMSSYQEAIYRASGSGVLVRDNDTILSISPLDAGPLTKFCCGKLNEIGNKKGIEFNPEKDDPFEIFGNIEEAERWLDWIIKGGFELCWDLREFGTNHRVQELLFFEYPIHFLFDYPKVFKWKKTGYKKQSPAEKQAKKAEKERGRVDEIHKRIYQACESVFRKGIPATAKNLAESIYPAVDQATVNRYLKDLERNGLAENTGEKDGKSVIWHVHAGDHLF